MNEIKGKGIKRLNNGQIEIGGYFENGEVNSKGYKKWKNMNEVYIYRGDLIKN
jgi:hypothetical protein